MEGLCTRQTEANRAGRDRIVTKYGNGGDPIEQGRDPLPCLLPGGFVSPEFGVGQGAPSKTQKLCPEALPSRSASSLLSNGPNTTRKIGVPLASPVSTRGR